MLSEISFQAFFFREYDENFAPMSLDEAYMDITDYLDLHPESSAWEVVQVGDIGYLPVFRIGSAIFFAWIWIRIRFDSVNPDP